MKTRRFSIVVADRSTGVVRRFSAAPLPILAAVLGTLALPVLIGAGAMLSSQAALTQLEATNARLQLENDSFRAATGELAAQISSLQSAVDEIGIQAIVDPDVDRAMSRLPPRVRERAAQDGRCEHRWRAAHGAFPYPRRQPAHGPVDVGIDDRLSADFVDRGLQR